VRSDSVTAVEAPWLELLRRDGEAAVRAELLERGLSPVRAGGLAWWLRDQAQGERFYSARTSAYYRRLLEELEAAA
jgi:hypothetical protein